MSYILFTADFDEKDSSVKTYKTLDEFVSDWTDEFSTYEEILAHITECEAEGDDPEHQASATVELITTGSYNAEWWDYHLVEVKENA